MELFYVIFIMFIFLEGVNLKRSHGKRKHVSRELQEPPILQLEDGQIIGRIKKSETTNKTYYLFQGIPYAKPPLGDLRFEPAIPSNPWNGTLNATTDRSSCIQQDGSGSEDCLYINVYTPSLKNKLPIMVWIYGGGFTSGNSSELLYDPEFLLDQDIVYVAFNYRLDVFGFLSTGDLTAPGNVGLKDQLLALKWVKKNIDRFGGDPNKVTIFGESAGAASVSLHVQSRSSAGLFHGAIMNSGTSLTLWSLTRIAKQMANELGKKLKLNTSDSNSLVKGLKTVDAQQLIKVSAELYRREVLFGNPNQGLPYGPVIEIEYHNAFLTNKSHQLISQGKFNKVPLLIGYNSQEAAVAAQMPDLVKLLFERFMLLPGKLVPIDMNANNPLTTIFVGNIIRGRYFGGNIAVSNKNFVQYISDDQFNRPIQESVRLQSQHVHTYFYVFSYEGTLSRELKVVRPGVGHAEDLYYIFKKEKNGTVNDIATRNKMVKMWSNFVKFKNPTPVKDPVLDNITWYPSNIINNNILVYLNISTTLSLDTNPNNENMEFWTKLYKENGHPPYNTY